MKHPMIILLSAFLLGACAQDNVLSSKEKKQGFQLLFDGKTPSAWRGAYQKNFPSKGWLIQDGALFGDLKEGGEAADGGDLVSIKTYKNFDFRFDWKLGALGNSGVKYFAQEALPKGSPGSQPGYEYQLIDDADFIYNGEHLPNEIKTGALYQLAAPNKPDVDLRRWHHSRIVVQGDDIQHYLDGKLVVSIHRKSSAFLEAFKKSKFHVLPDYPYLKEGHLLLQDHGHKVAFKNLKIREL